MSFTDSISNGGLNLNKHSWGPQRDASVIFLESVCMKITVIEDSGVLKDPKNAFVCVFLVCAY